MDASRENGRPNGLTPIAAITIVCGRGVESIGALAKRIRLGTLRSANWLQLTKFAVVGATGYAINLAVFAFAAHLIEFHHVVAAILAFCAAVTSNFLWNRRWTFRSTDGPAIHQGSRFLVVSLAGLGLNLGILVTLVDLWGAPTFPSQALAVAVVMPANFIGNKLWTFSG